MYVKKYNFNFIPNNFSDKELLNFIKNCRLQYLNKTLSKNKITQFESIKGWVWSQEEDKFNYAIGSLKHFTKKK